MTAEQRTEQRLRAMSAHTPTPSLDIARLNNGIEKHRRLIRMTKMISTAAAVIVLILSAVIITSAVARNQVYSTVTIDGSGSICLSLNREGEIVSITANDQNGKRALMGFDRTTNDPEQAVAELIAHLIDEKLLSEYDNTLLVTADNADDAVEEALRARFAEAVGTAYAENDFRGAVLSQINDDSREAQRLSSRYHISHGKAQLMRELIAADSSMSYRSLSRLNVNDLNLIADSIDLDYREITASGESSGMRYLKEGEAARIVIDDLSADSSLDITIRLDARDGELIYRLVVRSGKTAYTYNLVAESGEIITVVKITQNRAEIIVDNQSSTARTDDHTPAYTPPADTVVVTPAVPAAEADIPEPAVTETEPRTVETPTVPVQPATSVPTAVTPTVPAAEPTESTADRLPDTISFISAQYYRVESTMLDTGFTMPPWSTRPAGTLANTEVFRGNAYENSTGRDQLFESGVVAVIGNTTQLRNFLADHGYAYAQGGKTFDTAKYTDRFFKTESLILAAYDLKNQNYRFSIGDMTIDNGTLYLNTVMEQEADLPGTSYLAHDLTAYEVDRSSLESATQLKLY